MEIQWPLVIFTLGICLTSGTLAGMSFLALKGKGEKLLFPGLIVSLVSLVIGGIGSFLHLEHWERIFNGFGHITSGITQELIGCVVLAVLMVVWFFVLRGDKGVSKGLAWVTIVLAALMVVVTAHSYMMAARPAWGIGLVLFYLANAFLLGAIVIWALAVVKKDKDIETLAVRGTFFAAIAQIAVDVVYVIICAISKVSNYGYYLDPTRMTTNPIYVDNLANFALFGGGALYFWSALICAVIVLVCAVMAKKKAGETNLYLIIAAIGTLATALIFRAFIYVVGLSVFILY